MNFFNCLCFLMLANFVWLKDLRQNNDAFDPCHKDYLNFIKTHIFGDMILSPEQFQMLTEKSTSENIQSRNIIRDEKYRWPNGIVKYRICENIDDPKQRNIIEKAMNHIETRSCVRFVKAEEDEENFALIRPASGKECSSNVGYIPIGKLQFVNLSDRCFKSKGIIIHELLHTLGFYHQQSSPNRDDYIKIEENSMSQQTINHNFAKESYDNVTDFGFEYDFDSIMHYPSEGLLDNGNFTITPIGKWKDKKIGQSVGMSEIDIKKLRKMYKCDEN